MPFLYNLGEASKTKSKEERWKLEKEWFSKEVEETKKELQTDLENGLTSEQVESKQKEYGLNELKAKKKKTLFQKFL